MLQRKQTLFLLGVLTLAFTMFFTGIWEKKTYNFNKNISLKTEEHVVLNLDGFMITKTGNETIQIPARFYYLQGLSGLVCLNTIIIIFLYKKRKIQLLLNNLNNLFIAGLLVIIFFLIQYGETLIKGDLIGENYHLGIYLPPISIILTFFANKYIRKDEELIKSLDRIR